MTSIDLPSAELLGASPATIQGSNALVFPEPRFGLPHERDCPFQEDLNRDVEGHIRVTLPVYVRVEVFPEGPDTECFIIATLNKRRFGHGGDGLTIYGSVHRTDFAFRTNVFDGFPEDERHNHVRLRPGEWNEMAMVLAEDKATYWINRTAVATCFLIDGELPSAEALYIGLANYTTPYAFRGFDFSRDPAPLSVLRHRVITLHGVDYNDAFCIRCLNMSGEEAICLNSGRATLLSIGTEVAVRREITVHPCTSRGNQTRYQGNVSVRLRPGGIIGKLCQTFPDGAVTLMRSGVHPEHNSAIGRIFNTAAMRPSRLLYVPPREVAALQPQGDERLGEFRSRVAAGLGIFRHSLQLALPDGTFLDGHQDGQSLRAVLRPSCATAPSVATSSAGAADRPAPA